MKVLFLTSSPGYGHTCAAEAIELVLHNRYPDIETRCLDVTQLIDEEVSTVVKDSYLRMTAEQPGLYQKLYDMDTELYRKLAGEIPPDSQLVNFLMDQQRRWYPEAADYARFSFSAPYKNIDSALLNTLINGICNRTRIPAGRLLLRGLLGLIHSILATRLKNYVNSYAPGLLIATQMYPNALLAPAIQKDVIRQPLIGVLTDYGVHGVWVRDTTSLYCVSHDSVAHSLRQQGVAQGRIQVTGIPLRPQFDNPPCQTQARKNLGLDERRTVLVTGGQCGIGIADAVTQLIKDKHHSYHVLVTTGDTVNQCVELQQLAQQHPQQIRLMPWRNDMVGLLRATDVVVGKPGGLTVSEALACGRPFIATCCLGGQEAHNVKFLQDQGVGRIVNPGELATTLRGLFDNPQILLAMKARAEHLGRRDAARAVVSQVEALEKWQTAGAGAGKPQLSME